MIYALLSDHFVISFSLPTLTRTIKAVSMDLQFIDLSKNGMPHRNMLKNNRVNKYKKMLVLLAIGRRGDDVSTWLPE